MQNRGIVILAVVLILTGAVLLLGNLTDLPIASICFPLGIILLGVVFLFRPRMVGPDTNSHMVLFGDIERAGPGTLAAEETWGFILDATYDLTKYDVPPGETLVRVLTFISDVEIFVPADVGVAVNAASFVTEFKLDGGKEETSFLSPVNWRSDGYKMAERRVRFELTQFIGDVKLRRF